MKRNRVDSHRAQEPDEQGRMDSGPHSGRPGARDETFETRGLPFGCEIFYEFRLLFSEPVDSTKPPTKEVSVVFSQNEDLNADPQVAIFGFPVGETLSPGRTAAFDAFKIYQRMRWRVRTAIGGPVTSPWSPPIIQTATSSGIP